MCRELNLSHMLRSVDSHLGTLFRYGQLKRERHEELCRQIALLLLFAQKIRQLKLSGMEFAYLKAIAFTGADLPLRSPHHPPQLGWFCPLPYPFILQHVSSQLAKQSNFVI